jgi:membrane protease YdiL (CAAX protease family)
MNLTKFAIIFVKKRNMNTHFELENSLIHRILLLLIMVLTGLLLSYFFSLSVVFIQSGFNSAIFSEQVAKLSEDVFSMRLIQTIQSLFVFIIPSFILVKLYKEKPSEFLHLKKPDPVSVLIGMLSIVFMVPLINVLVEWNAGMHLPDALQGLESWMRTSEDAAEKVTERMLVGTTALDLVINLIIVAFLAGVGEEFFFRGLLQSLFEKAFINYSLARKGKKPKWAIHGAIWIIAFIFSAIHLQFYGFIPRLLLGAWFGYLLWWSGSIWIPVLAHFTNNALSTVFVYLKNKSAINFNPDKIGLNESWWLCLSSILLLCLCVYYFKRREIDIND